jgi:hypothetical protein
MPFILNAKEDVSELTQYKSVLIVPCRFCPAASSAVKNDEPYFEFWRHFLKTDSYERYIAALKSKLEASGIRTDIFRSRLIHQFVLCMWTSGRRRKLAEVAKDYEAVLVLGCEAAVQTIRDAVRFSSCDVVPGLESEGIMSIQPRLHLPCNLTLELESVTPLALQATRVGIKAKDSKNTALAQ